MGASKVFVMVVEAAEPTLLRRWMADGSLPHLAALARDALPFDVIPPRGVGANAFWPTLYSGTGPAEHGRYYHAQLDRGAYRAYREHQVAVRRPPVWERIADSGRRVGVFNLPKAPSASEFRGVQVRDWSTHFSYPAEFDTAPPALRAAIAARHGEKIVCPCLALRYRAPDGASLAAAVAQLHRNIRRTRDLLLDQLRAADWDLFLGALDELHCAGHLLWHLHDADYPLAVGADAIPGDPLLELYRAMDDAVGAVIAALPAGATTVLLAGPGMGPSYVRPELLDDILVALEGGAASPAKRFGGALKSLWRALPPWARRPLASLGHAADRRLTVSDRAGRRFFSLDSNDSVGGIRVNLRGREPDGLVPPAQFDAVCDELVRAIAAIRVVDSGEPLALDVCLASEVHEGGGGDALPDVLIEWNQRGPISAVHSPATGTIRQARLPDWSGTHSSRILALIRVAGRSPGAPAAARAEDIAPTLAALCGLHGGDFPGCDLLGAGRGPAAG
jgi:predicted AlkP superfamily phosphohydrolase/phosphomutase